MLAAGALGGAFGSPPRPTGAHDYRAVADQQWHHHKETEVFTLATALGVTGHQLVVPEAAEGGIRPWWGTGSAGEVWRKASEWVVEEGVFPNGILDLGSD